MSVPLPSTPPTPPTPPTAPTPPTPVEPPVVEIRVHGVNNTPPEQLLGVPSADDVELVAGDRMTGLYRATDTRPDRPVDTLAFSWGGLTNGQRAAKDIVRALWLLLLPLAFVNVAFWARPRFAGEEHFPSRTWLTSYMFRLLSVTVSVMFALTMTVIGVDLVAWQWTTLGRSDAGWLGGLTETLARAGTTSRGVLIGLALPALIVGVLYLASRRSFAYEAVTAVRRADLDAAHDLPESRGLSMRGSSFWSGAHQVRALASVHWHVALCLSAAVALAPVVALTPSRSVESTLGWALVGLLGACIALELVRLGTAEVTDRAATDETGHGGIGGTSRWLTRAALVLVVAYLARGVPLGERHGGLPYVNNVWRTIVVLQLFLVLVGAIAMRHSTKVTWFAVVACLAGGALAVLFMVNGWDAPRPWLSALSMGLALTMSSLVAFWLPGEGETLRQRAEAALGPVGARPAWNGAPGAVLAGLGLLLSAMYSGGVIWLVRRYLPGGERLESPDILTWVSAGVPVYVLIALVAAVLAYRRLRSMARGLVDSVLADYRAHRDAHDRVRAFDVARARALHTVFDRRAIDWVGSMAATAFAGVVLVTALSASGRSYAKAVGSVPDSWPGWIRSALLWLPTGGSFMSLGMLLGFATLGLLVYRGDPRKRAIAVVWDLATFWPRASHPFAPPCYAERCVPQLVTRIRLDPDRRFILAGHSQGAVICVATLLQLAPAERARVDLITFGTQLNRLYGRVFPAFFGPGQLQNVARGLTGEGGIVRWRSFHRSTDPLGYPVDVCVCGDDGTTYEVDAHLEDPAALRPVRGEILDPVINKHSDYPLDPHYVEYRDAVVARLLTPEADEVRRRQ